MPRDDELRQALIHMAAVEKEMEHAVQLLADAYRRAFEDQMPEVPDDDTLANLGRFGEAR
jgi:hypothetical protein